MKIFIGIVNYNRSCFLREQLARFDRYLLRAKDDEVNISVADNSNSIAERNVNKAICKELGARYMDYDHKDGDPSQHHSMSLNALYQTSIEEQHDFTFFVDHDTFMYAPSNIIYNTRGKHFAGVGQQTGGGHYLHPNCLLINNKFVPREIVELKPAAGMDTGGAMAEYIKTLKGENINYVNFDYGSVKYSGTHSQYEKIDNSFMHYIKGSNWDNNPKGKERQEELTKELQRISE